MSILHPEEVRRCKRCGHSWLAEKYTKSGVTSPGLGIGITSRAQDLHRQTVHERRQSKYDMWRFCPKCQSRRTKTLTGRAARDALSVLRGSDSSQADAAKRSKPKLDASRFPPPPKASVADLSHLPPPPPQAVPPPPPSPPQAAQGTQSVADELIKLKDLYEAGAISEGEYEDLKRRVIYG